MSRPLALFLVFLVSACGFQPLQGKAYRETLAVNLSSVVVNVKGSSVIISGGLTNIPRRYGELLKAEIEDNVNPKGGQNQKQFMLDVNFTESDMALFVNPDGTASRGDLIYSSSYTITRLADGKRVAQGTLRRVSSYNSSPTADYASYVSIEDARKRGMVELGEDYKLRLAALLPTLNDPSASAIEEKSKDIPELQPLRTNETIRSGN